MRSNPNDFHIYWALPEARVSWHETCDKFPKLRNDPAGYRVDLQPFFDVVVKRLKRQKLWS